MINRLIISLVIIFSYMAGVSGQHDPVAGKILEKFSIKALEAPSVTMIFSLTINDAVEGTNETIEGDIAISGNMYKLRIPDNIIWYNGKVVWTYTPDFEEVSISDPDTTGSLFITNPSALFSLYKAGYKYRLIEETSTGSVIDLYPEDIDTDFSRIRMLIDRGGLLAETEYKRKDGITLYLKVTKYDLSKNYPDSWFSFNSLEYPNTEIIDMRF